MSKRFAGQAISAGVVVAIVIGAWAALAPTVVTRGEMTNYVEATALSGVKEIKASLTDLTKSNVEVRERLAAVEAVLRKGE